MIFQVFVVILFSGYLVLLTFLVAHQLFPSKTRQQIATSSLQSHHSQYQSIVELHQVHKSFDSPVIQGISFKVRQGETLGILGQSGSGKSVTLKLITGFLKPDSGHVVFANKNLNHMYENELLALRKRVAYVFQGGAIFDFLNIQENIAYPLREMGTMDESMINSRVQYLLQAVGLEDQAQLQGDELSIGTKKLVAISRAIASNPEVILYDEPTAGLDPLARKSLTKHIQRLSKQQHLTSIVVTHDLKCLEILADRIILLKDGMIRFEGRQEDFNTSSDPFVQAFITGRSADERTRDTLLG
ncbi:MAG: ATP-binding cassette domain-containing protein [Acidobacteriota bacterium]|nr:ATP-binding cassette domain-containing protein [Acidobacteriota bacterium]